MRITSVILLCLCLASCQQVSDIFDQLTGKVRCHDEVVKSILVKMILGEVEKPLVASSEAAALTPAILNSQTMRFDLIVDATETGAPRLSCTAQFIVKPLPNSVPVGPLISRMALLHGLLGESLSLSGLSSGRSSALDNRPDVVEGESIRWNISYEAAPTSDGTNIVVSIDKPLLQGIGGFLATYIQENSKILAAAPSTTDAQDTAPTLASEQETNHSVSDEAGQVAASRTEDVGNAVAASELANLEQQAHAATSPELVNTASAPLSRPSESQHSDVQRVWARSLAAALRHNWLRPPGAADFICKINVQLLPNGLVESVRIVETSGSPATDDSVINAVHKASPLPLPSDPSAFVSELNLSFRP